VLVYDFLFVNPLHTLTVSDPGEWLNLVLLLFVGQTIIFLLRLVAADRRSDARRRPLRSQSKTVGEIEDERAEHAEDEPDGGGVRE